MAAASIGSKRTMPFRHCNKPGRHKGQPNRRFGYTRARHSAGTSGSSMLSPNYVVAGIDEAIAIPIGAQIGAGTDGRSPDVVIGGIGIVIAVEIAAERFIL